MHLAKSLLAQVTASLAEKLLVTPMETSLEEPTDTTQFSDSFDGILEGLASGQVRDDDEIVFGGCIVGFLEAGDDDEPAGNIDPQISSAG